MAYQQIKWTNVNDVGSNQAFNAYQRSSEYRDRMVRDALNTGIGALQGFQDRREAAIAETKSTNTEYAKNRLNQINSLNELEQLEQSGFGTAAYMQDTFGGAIDMKDFNKSYADRAKDVNSRAFNRDGLKDYNPETQEALRQFRQAQAAGDVNAMTKWAGLINGSMTTNSTVGKDTYDIRKDMLNQSNKDRDYDYKVSQDTFTNNVSLYEKDSALRTKLDASRLAENKAKTVYDTALETQMSVIQMTNPKFTPEKIREMAMQSPEVIEAQQQYQFAKGNTESVLNNIEQFQNRFGQTVGNNQESQISTGSASGIYTDFNQDISSFIAGHEGFRTDAYVDKNDSGQSAGYRIGYGSDTITKADGRVIKVTPSMRITKADAKRDLDRRIKQEFMPQVTNIIGKETFNNLNKAQQAALVSLAYRGDIYAGKQDLLAKALKKDIANNDYNFSASQKVIRERKSKFAGVRKRLKEQADMLGSWGGTNVSSLQDKKQIKTNAASIDNTVQEKINNTSQVIPDTVRRPFNNEELIAELTKSASGKNTPQTLQSPFINIEAQNNASNLSWKDANTEKTVQQNVSSNGNNTKSISDISSNAQNEALQVRQATAQQAQVKENNYVNNLKRNIKKLQRKESSIVGKQKHINEVSRKAAIEGRILNQTDAEDVLKKSGVPYRGKTYPLSYFPKKQQEQFIKGQLAYMQKNPMTEGQAYALKSIFKKTKDGDTALNEALSDRVTESLAETLPSSFTNLDINSDSPIDLPRVIMNSTKMQKSSILSRVLPKNGNVKNSRYNAMWYDTKGKALEDGKGMVALEKYIQNAIGIKDFSFTSVGVGTDFKDATLSLLNTTQDPEFVASALSNFISNATQEQNENMSDMFTIFSKNTGDIAEKWADTVKGLDKGTFKRLKQETNETLQLIPVLQDLAKKQAYSMISDMSDKELSLKSEKQIADLIVSKIFQGEQASDNVDASSKANKLDITIQQVRKAYGKAIDSLKLGPKHNPRNVQHTVDSEALNNLKEWAKSPEPAIREEALQFLDKLAREHSTIVQ